LNNVIFAIKSPFGQNRGAGTSIVNIA